MMTDARDRHGDILEPGGAQIAAYLRNPVVLWAHDYRALPIGRVTSLIRDGRALKAEILFAATDFAREAHELYAQGFLRGWSVGFLPLEWRVIEDEEGRFAGYHVRSWELIELSAVPVPANPEALTDALSTGQVREPALMKSLEEALRTVPPDSGSEGRRVSEADALPALAGAGQPENGVAPEVSLPVVAAQLAPKLLARLRPSLGEAVAREIRRRQGRLEND
jgi:HK97 family phage prohead protease